MKQLVLIILLTAAILAGCVLRTGPEGSEVMIVPPLPVVVELDLEPFYFHSGYFYHYGDDHHWSYSRARSGPWQPLPPGHYPKEVKWKRKYRDRDRDHHHDHDDDD